MDRLSQYETVYGKIIFPCDDILLDTDEAKARKYVYANPAEYLYSFDGIHWMNAPMDIGKIRYWDALFMKRPAGVTVGVSHTMKINPAAFEYSVDNGFSWNQLSNSKESDWIYHGEHDTTWFRIKNQ